jgi:hypothetical protein
MRWFAARNAISLALLFCAGLLAQQAGINGVAIDAVTRQPMAGVHIMVRAMPALGSNREDADTYGAISRPDGHFSIADLKPGVYYLTAQHNGYVQVRSKNSPVLTVTLKSGELPPAITVQLTPHAVMIGHVLDEYGDPVQHAQVLAESDEGSDSARTDERGQFRISLAPGKYYVQALADPTRRSAFADGVPEIRTDGMLAPVYGATFYPAAASRDKATAIELAPGQNLSGVDIHLGSKRSVSIRGRVTGMPEKSGGAPAYVLLLSTNTGAMNHGSFTQPAFTQPDGTFAIAGLTPGKYRLMARFQIQDAPDLQSAVVEMEAETDESNVVLALDHGEPLSGTVEIEGDAPKPPVREKLGVRLSPEVQFGESKGADVDEGGAFHIDGVFPGKLRVTVTPLPENAYVKSIRTGTAEAQDGLLDLSSGLAGAQIHITVSRNGARVEGRVLGQDGQPFAGPALVVMGQSADQPDDKGIQPTEAGDKFSYSGLPPGKYRIMALDPEQFMGGQDFPETLKSLLAHAGEIELHEGDRITKDITIMPAGNADAK